MTSLAEVRPEHFDLIGQWLDQPSVNQWLNSEWRRGQPSRALLPIVLRNQKNRLYLVKHDDSPCGIAALGDIDAIDKTGMVWYLLGDSGLSGRGITTQAVRLLVDRAFNELGLVSLYAWAMDNNIASQRVLSKAGFKESGRIRKSAAFNGTQVDRIFFDLVNSDR